MTTLDDDPAPAAAETTEQFAERVMSAIDGASAAILASGFDEDFVVTYVIGLGYQGDLGRLRRHYSAARQN
jgi:hypothetical protein